MSSNRSVTGSFPIHILLFVECFTSRFDLNRLEKKLYLAAQVFTMRKFCVRANFNNVEHISHIRDPH